MKATSSLIFILNLAASYLFLVPAACAGSATWNLDPTSSDWNVADNWLPATVPNNPSDIATFGLSNRTAVAITTDLELDSIVFNPGASAYTITTNLTQVLTLSGAGIVNDSGVTQTFISSANSNRRFGAMIFANNSSVGPLTTVLNQPAGGRGAKVIFQDSATAGHGFFDNVAGNPQGGLIDFYDGSNGGAGSFVNHASTNSIYLGGTITFHSWSAAGEADIMQEYGGFTYFYDHSTADRATFSGRGWIWFFGSSTAGHATFDLAGGPVGSFGGTVYFNESSTAGSAKFIANGATGFNAYGAQVIILSSAGRGKFTANGSAVAGEHCGGQIIVYGTAGRATFIINDGIGQGQAGSAIFDSSVDLGSPRIKVYGQGYAEFGGVSAPSPTVSSIEGTGHIHLGYTHLTVDAADGDLAFDGVIEGSEFLGSRGSLVKSGRGTLELSQASTYPGDTTVKQGTLLINNTSGSGTGDGDVIVEGGATLGGSGIIAGSLTIGANSNKGGSNLSPGHESVPGTLTIAGELNCEAGNLLNSYNCQLDSDSQTADQVVANGVTI